MLCILKILSDNNVYVLAMEIVRIHQIEIDTISIECSEIYLPCVLRNVLMWTGM